MNTFLLLVITHEQQHYCITTQITLLTQSELPEYRIKNIKTKLLKFVNLFVCDVKCNLKYLFPCSKLIKIILLRQ